MVSNISASRRMTSGSICFAWPFSIRLTVDRGAPIALASPPCVQSHDSRTAFTFSPRRADVAREVRGGFGFDVRGKESGEG